MKLRSRKRKDGKVSWLIDYREGGRRRRKVLQGIESRKVAESAFREFVSKYERGLIALPTEEKLSVSDCLDAYLEAKRPNCVEAHIGTLESRIRHIIEYFGENTPVRSLDEKAVNGFKMHLKAQGLVPPTINKKLGILKAAVAGPVKDGKIARNALEDIENVSDPRTAATWRYLTEEEIDRVLDVLKNGAIMTIRRHGGRNYDMRVNTAEDIHAFVVFLLNTGARKGEASDVRWSDVDFGAGIVRLNTRKRAARGRSAKPRYIPMNDGLRQLLESMAHEGEFVFGKISNLRRKFMRACTLAGIGHCRIHDLRHTFASLLAMRGVPLLAINELLGHSTMQMTLRYAHLAPSATADAVATLNVGAKKKGVKIMAVGGERGSSLQE